MTSDQTALIIAQMYTEQADIDTQMAGIYTLQSVQAFYMLVIIFCVITIGAVLVAMARPRYH